MRRGCVALVAAIVSLAGVPAVVHGQSPADIHLGFTPLTLVAEGSRTDQLGGEALYTVAVYAEGRPLDLARLAKAETAKALRIEVVSDDDPFAPLTRPWRRELVPRLDPVATTHLRAILGSMRKGDVLLVEYAPGQGTTILGNRLTAVSRAPHDLMVAFLDQWLGQRPVSEDLKRTLLEWSPTASAP
jgi:chalcone isomerase-like protein